MSSGPRVVAGRPDRWAVLVLLVALAAVSCADDERQSVVVVFAAASLSDAFSELEFDFEESHPDVDVRLNLASSTTLREQILSGAPGDVLVTADPTHVDQLIEADEISSPGRVLVRNRMAIGVPVGNPGAVSDLSDFADDELEIGLCAAVVPCGRLARMALQAAGVTPAVDTDEPDVRALVTKLEADELDAGIVYVSDVVSGSGMIEGLDIDDDVNPATEYPIALLDRSANPEHAGEFVDFALSAAGQQTLARHGFETP